ncbi:MAG: hypothetical protein WA182_19475 [Candidatus Sulfotelmatobacter sp.]
MRLTKARTTFQSPQMEVIEVAFSDHREAREYPDFSVAIAYPRTWSSEQVRMDLFAFLASAKEAFRAQMPVAAKFAGTLC